jgi:hypothetical protein
MKRRVLAATVLAAAAWMVVASGPASAHGRRGGCAPPCAPVHYTGCAPAGHWAYVDKEVTCHKAEWVTKDVDVWVNELKPKTEKYKYWVCVPTTVKEKVTVCEWRHVQQPFKYTVLETVSEPAKVKVCKPKWVSHEVPYTWKECVTKTKPGKQTVWDCVLEPKTVTCSVPVYKTVSVPACPPCGGCWHGCGAPCGAVAYACQTVCEMVPHTYTVHEKKLVSREIDVTVCYHEWVEHSGKRTVHQCVHEWVDVDTVVHKCVPVEKDGVRTVCQPVHVQKEIDVCRPQLVEKDGERTVYECVSVKKTVKQSHCVQVPYTTVVKVPVWCPAPVVAACGPVAPCCH